MANVKIEDLIPKDVQVEVSPGKFLNIRPLELQEMMTLFIGAQDLFMNLYAAVQAPGTTYQKLSPLLLAAPEFVANVIAAATDSVGQEKAIRRLPAAVQLIAVHECWRLSVPEPKKLGELLSVVTGELRKLRQEGEQVDQKQPQQNPLVMESANLSSSLSPPVTESQMSGITH